MICELPTNKVGKFSINLSGLPSGYIDKFVGKEPEGKRVVVYKCFLDINTLFLNTDRTSCLSLTFDDGLESHYTTVYPLLKEKNFPRLLGKGAGVPQPVYLIDFRPIIIYT